MAAKRQRLDRRRALRLLQASPAASSAKTQPPFLLPSCMSCPFARILRLRRGFPLYFFEKMRYTIKHHLWRCSQALRRGACKPLIPVFNSGHRLQPSHSCTCRSFFLQNGLACDSESIGIRIAIVVVALPFSNETHTLSDRIPRLLLLPAAMMCILVDSLRLEDHQHDRTGNN